MFTRFKIGTHHVMAVGLDREHAEPTVRVALVDTEANHGPAYLCAWAQVPREDIIRLRDALTELIFRTAPRDHHDPHT